MVSDKQHDLVRTMYMFEHFIQLGLRSQLLFRWLLGYVRCRAELRVRMEECLCLRPLLACAN